MFKVTGDEFGDVIEDLAYIDEEEEGHADDLRTPKTRANTIEYYKTAVSWYMPNRLQA